MSEASRLRMLFETQGDAAAIASMRKMDAGLRQIEASGSRMGGVLGTAFGTMGGFIGAQVVGRIFEFGRGILMANANAETMMMSLETVAGGRAQKIFDNLQDFAKQTPFEFPELVQSAINLESFGLKTDEWMTTIGDTASAMGKSVDQVTQAVLDAQGNQFERLKELGIMANVEGDKLKFTYMKNGQQIVEEVDKNNKALVNSTIQGIWNSKYEGAMEKQSKSFMGQWSTLKDNVSMTLQNLSGGIFEFAKTGLGFFNDIFANGFAATIRDTFGPSAGEFVENVTAMGQGIIDAFGEGSTVKSIVDGLPESWQPFADVVLTAADAFGQMWTNLKQGDWGGLAEDLQQLASVGVDLGKIVISGTIELAGDLAGGFWQKVKNYAGVGAGDGTGGPEPGLPPMDIGEILVSAVVRLSGDLADISASIEREIGLQRTPAELEAARQAGYKAGQDFAQAAADGIEDGAELPEGDKGGLWESIKKVLWWEPPMFRDDEPTIIDEWIAYGNGLGDGIRGWVIEGITTGIQNKAASEVSDAIDWVATGATIFQQIKVGLDIALGELGDLKVSWPSDWKLDFKPPSIGDFPSWNDIFNVAWTGLQRLGALSSPWPNEWKLSFSMPSLGDFPDWNDIFNLVWSGLKGLGGLSIGWPNSFSIDMGTPSIGWPSWAPKPYAAGGLVSGGLSLVGERGPELVNLPRGSYVHTAGETAAMLRGSGGSVTNIYYVIEGAIMGGDIDRYIQDRINSGQAKRMDRSIRGARLAESY